MNHQNNLLRRYLINLLNGLQECDNERINWEQNCHKSGKSSQKVLICKDNVYKGPSEKYFKHFNLKGKEETVNRVPVKILELGNNDMNLLIQSIFSKEFGDKNLERYKTICRVCDLSKHKRFNYYEGLKFGKKQKTCTYSLVSDKASGIKNFNRRRKSKKHREIQLPANSFTLEDYIQNNIPYFLDKDKEVLIEKYSHQDPLLQEKKDLFIDTIVNCINQLFRILDYLYEEIQFHHCDPKAGQLLIIKVGKRNYVMLSDFDKITFTINIDNEPVRIRNRYPFRNILQTRTYKTKKLNEPLKMRTDTLPKKNNTYEKLGFLSSILLCFGFTEDHKDQISLSKSKILYDLLLRKLHTKHLISFYDDEKKIYINEDNNIFIDYNKISSNLGKGSSLSTSSSLLHIKDTANIFCEPDKLNSSIHINNNSKLIRVDKDRRRHWKLLRNTMRATFNSNKKTKKHSPKSPGSSKSPKSPKSSKSPKSPKSN